jgi:hypothetical protein
MKKLAVVVMMIAIATFMAAAMASADDHDGWGIHGQYAMTGAGTCIYAPGGFNANFTPIGPTNWSASNMVQGSWTFKRHGKGTTSGKLFGTAATPFAVPNATSIEFAFDFTYTVTDDGTIAVEMVPGTFLATALTGPSAGLTYTVDIYSFVGMVSPDHKTLTLNNANEVQTLSLSNGTTNHAICNIARVLIWLGE